MNLVSSHFDFQLLALRSCTCDQRLVLNIFLSLRIQYSWLSLEQTTSISEFQCFIVHFSIQ